MGGPVCVTFYDHDGRSISAPGIVILGEIARGPMPSRGYDGTVDVTIEAVD